MTGAVFKPGLYPLTREHYTILDVISEAGGLTKEAGSLVDFIPAENGANSAAFQVASTGAKLPIDANAQNAAEHQSRPIHVDLNELFAGGNVVALNLPVIAGDVVYVPEAGSFTIEGWVDKPGTYPLVHDGSGKVVGDYGVSGFPETFFVDRRGRIVGDHVAGPVSRKILDRNIRLALRS